MLTGTCDISDRKAPNHGVGATERAGQLSSCRSIVTHYVVMIMIVHLRSRSLAARQRTMQSQPGHPAPSSGYRLPTLYSGLLLIMRC